VADKTAKVNKKFLTKLHTPQYPGYLHYSGGTTRFIMTVLRGAFFFNSCHVSVVANLLNVEMFFLLTNFSFSRIYVVICL
jgi:hypothetical protein